MSCFEPWLFLCKIVCQCNGIVWSAIFIGADVNVEKTCHALDFTEVMYFLIWSVYWDRFDFSDKADLVALTWHSVQSSNMVIELHIQRAPGFFGDVGLDSV